MKKCTYNSVICISLPAVRSLLGNRWNYFGGLCAFALPRRGFKTLSHFRYLRMPHVARELRVE